MVFDGKGSGELAGKRYPNRLGGEGGIGKEAVVEAAAMAKAEAVDWLEG